MDLTYCTCMWINRENYGPFVQIWKFTKLLVFILPFLMQFTKLFLDWKQNIEGGGGGQIQKIEQFWFFWTLYDFLHIQTSLMMMLSNFYSLFRGQTSDSEQYSNHIQLDLNYNLINFSCVLGPIMTRYDFFVGRRMSEVRTDSNLT